MASPTKGNIAIYILMATLAILSLIILFQLRRQFESNLDTRVADLQRVFSNRDILKGPSDYRINFGNIESEVAKYENRGEFGPIKISKVFGNTQRVVYPFYVSAFKDAGRQVPAELKGSDSVETGFIKKLFSTRVTRDLSLVADGETIGSLSVNLDTGTLRTVSVVIWALAAMLAASLAFLGKQFRRQEIVISTTTVELEQKRRELVRLERLSLAGQLSANILHDLKKPVLNIRNEAEEALHPAGETSPEPPATIFTRMRDQADFFLSVLREGGFDRFVRSSDEREYVDINDLLERSLALVRYERGSIEIVRQYGNSLPAILAEPVRLIQVFSNLILNASQAMDGKGTLTISTSEQSDSHVLITIADNGPGIPANLVEKIFEPFYTTKAEGQGTGLGLYIVRDILKDLGGTIHVTSRPGETRFEMRLPAAK